jgi:hypothetical protein
LIPLPGQTEKPGPDPAPFKPARYGRTLTRPLLLGRYPMAKG